MISAILSGTSTSIEFFFVSLISVNVVSMFVLLILIEVEPNTSNVFPRFYI